MTKKSFVFAMLMFVLGGLVYVIFDLYAPYCAKHPCCSSAGGWWALMPNLSAILLLIGFITIILGVFDYEAPEERNMKTKENLNDLLGVICDTYNAHREILGVTHEQAKHTVQTMYDDLHEWLYEK